MWYEHVTSAHSWMVGMTLHLGTVTNVTRDGCLGCRSRGWLGCSMGCFPRFVMSRLISTSLISSHR
jgi:hypothetical protein